MKKIIIYSAPSCHICQQAKKFLADNNLEFIDYDISADEARMREVVEKSGQMSIPIIFIDDEMVIGFDRSKIEELIQIN